MPEITDELFKISDELSKLQFSIEDEPRDRQGKWTKGGRTSKHPGQHKKQPPMHFPEEAYTHLDTGHGRLSVPDHKKVSKLREQLKAKGQRMWENMDHADAADAERQAHIELAKGLEAKGTDSALDDASDIYTTLGMKEDAFRVGKMLSSREWARMHKESKPKDKDEDFSNKLQFDHVVKTTRTGLHKTVHDLGNKVKSGIQKAKDFIRGPQDVTTLKQDEKTAQKQERAAAKSNPKPKPAPAPKPAKPVMSTKGHPRHTSGNWSSKTMQAKGYKRAGSSKKLGRGHTWWKHKDGHFLRTKTVGNGIHQTEHRPASSKLHFQTNESDTAMSTTNNKSVTDILFDAADALGEMKFSSGGMAKNLSQKKPAGGQQFDAKPYTQLPEGSTHEPEHLRQAGYRHQGVKNGVHTWKHYYTGTITHTVPHAAGDTKHRVVAAAAAGGFSGGSGQQFASKKFKEPRDDPKAKTPQQHIKDVMRHVSGGHFQKRPYHSELKDSKGQTVGHRKTMHSQSGHVLQLDVHGGVGGKPLKHFAHVHVPGGQTMVKNHKLTSDEHHALTHGKVPEGW